MVYSSLIHMFGYFLIRFLICRYQKKKLVLFNSFVGSWEIFFMVGKDFLISSFMYDQDLFGYILIEMICLILVGI